MSTTVVRMKFGSHLYGTSTPESDLDFKAVHIPSAAEILLQRVKGSVCSLRPKSEGEKNVAGEVDEESYSLQRYLGLLAEGQTVAIDMLFAPDYAILQGSAMWEFIRAHRASLLNKRSAAFVGYCRTQANKYGIKGSRVAAVRKASELFSAELSSRGSTAKLSEIADKLRELKDDHTAVMELPVAKDGRTEWFFECCNRKVSFGSTIKQGCEVYSNIYANYGKRAQLAETNEGVDWKALSHAVRVAQEAIELLETGNITFPLATAPHILEIKKGLLPYEQVATEIEGLLVTVEESSAASKLPESADSDFIDRIVLHAYRREVNDLPPATSACSELDATDGARNTKESL